MEKILQINIGELEKEIEGLRLQFSSVESELNFKVSLRDYLLKNGELTRVSNATAAPVKENSGGIISISQFIFEELAKGESKAKDMIDTYEMLYGGENLVNRFYNTLSRLRNSGHIENKDAPGERGGIWYLIKNKKPQEAA
jgi:hypothetical protein